MSLLKDIKDRQIKAMKEKNKVEKTVTTLIISEAQSRAKQAKREVSDDDVLASIKAQEKKTVGALDSVREEMKSSGIESINPDFESLSLKEIEILRSFLPTQLTEEEITKYIKSELDQDPSIKEQGKKAIGLLMNKLKESFPGQIDGKTASTAINKELSS